MPRVNGWNFLIISLLLIWSLCRLPSVIAAEPEQALAILEKTAAYYQTLDNFRAAYRLTIHYPEEEQVYTSIMTITAQGQQYRLRYDQQETITDGETIWVYDKTLQELTISSYDQTDYPLNFAELSNLYQQGYRFAYMGEVVVSYPENGIRDLVQLTPIREDSSFQHITLAIDRATAQIHGWEIVQNEETKYACTVRSFSVNLPLPDDYFTFDPMAHGDLDIIDLRENEQEVEER